MVQFARRENGAAPFWESIDVSTGDVTPSGVCIGFYVETSGVVSFNSNGATVTPDFAPNQFVSAQVEQFNQSGTTATGIYALYL